MKGEEKKKKKKKREKNQSDQIGSRIHEENSIDQTEDLRKYQAFSRPNALLGTLWGVIEEGIFGAYMVTGQSRSCRWDGR